jgi:hypothetical protein
VQAPRLSAPSKTSSQPRQHGAKALGWSQQWQRPQWKAPLTATQRLAPKPLGTPRPIPTPSGNAGSNRTITCEHSSGQVTANNNQSQDTEQAQSNHQNPVRDELINEHPSDQAISTNPPANYSNNGPPSSDHTANIQDNFQIFKASPNQPKDNVPSDLNDSPPIKTLIPLEPCILNPQPAGRN